MVLLVACAAVLGLATLRLALVTAATPRGLWLVEYPPLLPEPGTVEAATIDRARWVGRLVSDPRLGTALLAPCTDARAAARAADDLVALQAATTECLVRIDEALDHAPLSGELWLQKALLQFELGDFPGFENSLRLSFETAPREGWIAARRAPLGVMAHGGLPDDLKALVMGDLALLLTHKSLADSFVARFVADETFREKALPLVEQLPAADQETFLGFVSAAGGR
jgi:hypothetical protein